MNFQIHLIERNKNFKVKNVHIMSKDTNDEVVKNAIEHAIKEIGFLNRFRPYYKERLIKKILQNINNYYESSLYNGTKTKNNIEASTHEL